eukprot:3506177-Alexandrium_andersonii.AAC.1
MAERRIQEPMPPPPPAEPAQARVPEANPDPRLRRRGYSVYATREGKLPLRRVPGAAERPLQAAHTVQ